VAHSTPLVRFDTLLYQHNGQKHNLKVGTPEWYAWLHNYPTFAFSSEYGSFTARKETAGNRRGGAYWKAYRTRNGKLHRAYLGKSDALTLERLNEIAFVLSSETEKISIHPTRPALDLDSVNVQPSNLPAHLSPLIGREQNISAICNLLKQLDIQLLTLVGTGGVGKTSLAIHVASELQYKFPHGVYVVSLAPISDPKLVISVIAQAFGLRASSDRSFLDFLVEFLHSRQLLLVLDNFEQVIPAAPLLADLMLNCPMLKLLVTSRESLSLRQERVFPVLPLGLPDLKELPDTRSLSQFAAIDLFVQRTQAVKADFLLTEANASIVADICARLDGLPLAIELAATRMRLLSPQQLLVRLGQRLQVLTGGSSDLPVRQQTLRSTIKWSYDLLNVEEQRLFQILAIFVGGCSIEAVESVSESIILALGGEPLNVLDACISLLDKQLIQQRQQTDGDSRLYMLETIREFALECLFASNKADLVGEAHARYYQAFVEKSAPPVFDPEEMEWFDKLDQEQDNLRASLNWFIKQQDAEMALRLSGTLVRYWGVRGYMHEARQWLEQALKMRESASMPAAANALSGAGWLSIEFGEYAQAETLCKESLMLYQQLDDVRGMALAYHRLGGAYSRINDAASRVALEESVSLYREIGDKGGLAYSLMSLGTVNLTHGENSLAQLQIQESLEQCREQRNKEGIAWSLLMLALLLLTENNLSKVMSLLEESLVLFNTISNKQGRARALILMGELMSKQGKYVAARSFLEESLVLLKKVGSRQFIAQSLLKLASTAAIQGDAPAARTYYEESLAIIKDLTIETGLAASLEDFRKVYLSQEHLESRHPHALSHSAPTYPAGLTAREVEVLRLVANGLTNAQIAQQLVISTRTVNAHMRSIYNKLEISSRTAATRFAIDHHLL
jgi:predicted ATPase/DNA-binding CsgD family transcriptional regulator